MGVRTSWSDDYEKSLKNCLGLVVGTSGSDGIIYGSQDPDLSNKGPFIVTSYYYHFNHYIAVGGFCGFGHVQDWLGFPSDSHQRLAYKEGYTHLKGSSIFLLPSVKFSWLNNRWCSLYMKAMAGLHYQHLYLDSENIPTSETDKFDKQHTSFAYCFNPLGLEIGKKNVRGFIEFGLGSNWNFQMGLTYRFGKY